MSEFNEKEIEQIRKEIIDFAKYIAEEEDKREFDRCIKLAYRIRKDLQYEKFVSLVLRLAFGLWMLFVTISIFYLHLS